MRTTEIESVEQLDEKVAAGATKMRRWQLVDLDLREREDVLLRLDAAGALFLGCRLSDATADVLRTRGALIFPEVPDVPFNAYRAELYSPAELYDGLDGGYEQTPDARIYSWAQRVTRPMPGGVSIRDSLAMALHDNAIDDALAEFVEGRRVVGVMGGHAVKRGDPGYAEAARLGRDLGRAGFTVATGGGPGAMEAANLGAALADADDGALDEALSTLSSAPDFHLDITTWARAGFAVTGATSASLGVPTWFYGHEPPNAFATAVAKYFRNAIREDILLHVCRAGLVFLPGAAGTVQEVFQSACENYYAAVERVAPMVLVGRDFWTERLPAWPLLDVLAVDRPFAARLSLVDTTDDVLGRLGGGRGDGLG